MLGPVEDFFQGLLEHVGENGFDHHDQDQRCRQIPDGPYDGGCDCQGSEARRQPSNP